MDGERRFVLVMLGLGAVCATVLYGFLFISLWPYRTYVGVSLLVLLAFVVILGCVVNARGKLNEQKLRRQRYHFQQEIPLDQVGEPHYWPAQAQVNPHRMASVYHEPYGLQTKQQGLDQFPY